MRSQQSVIDGLAEPIAITVLPTTTPWFVLKESAGIEVVKAVRAVHVGQRYLSQKISDQLVDDYVRQRQSS